MGKIGNFDTDLDALFKRVNTHKNFGSFNINNWIFSNLSIDKNQNILDLGCGFGSQTIELLKMGCFVTAIDSNKDSLEYLKKKAATSKLTIIHSKFDELETLPINSFDNVISCYAFYYANDYNSLMRNIFQSMKDKSKIFICGPSKKNNIEMKRFLNLIGVDFGEGSAPFMEEKLPMILNDHFGNFKSLDEKNRIEFPNPKSVWDYWSSHNMFNKDIESKFKDSINIFFKDNDKFTTTKIIRGVISQKN